MADFGGAVQINSVPTGPASGDLGGSFPSPTVTNIHVGSDVQGDILYRNGTVWTRLPAGTAGNVLQTGGASANPSWTTVSAALGAASGDLAGTYPAPTVAKVQNVSVSATTPVDGQDLYFNGTLWLPRSSTAFGAETQLAWMVDETAFPLTNRSASGISCDLSQTHSTAYVGTESRGPFGGRSLWLSEQRAGATSAANVLAHLCGSPNTFTFSCWYLPTPSSGGVTVSDTAIMGRSRSTTPAQPSKGGTGDWTLVLSASDQTGTGGTNTVNTFSHRSLSALVKTTGNAAMQGLEFTPSSGNPGAQTMCIPVGVWSFIVFTYTGGIVRLYAPVGKGRGGYASAALAGGTTLDWVQAGFWTLGAWIAGTSQGTAGMIHRARFDNIVQTDAWMLAEARRGPM